MKNIHVPLASRRYSTALLAVVEPDLFPIGHVVAWFWIFNTPVQTLNHAVRTVRKSTRARRGETQTLTLNSGVGRASFLYFAV